MSHPSREKPAGPRRPTTVIGFGLLALVLLATLLYVPIALTIRPLSGPDSMELFGVIFLGLVRALALAAAISIAAARGGFAWIHPSRSAQWLAMTAALCAVAGMELWSVVAATSWYGRAGRPWVVAFAVAAPILLTILTWAGLNRGQTLLVGARGFRRTALVLVVLLLAGGMDLGIRNRSARQEQRAYAAALAAEEQRALDEKLSAFRALGPESPLRSWLAYTADSADEIREAAVDSIRARPGLNRELAEILRSDDPLPAIRWLWLWTPAPPETLAPALRDAASRLPAWAGRRFDDQDPTNDGDVGTACEALVVLADAFRGTGVDFREPITALSAFLRSRALPDSQMSYDKTYQARSMLQAWFDAHPNGTEPGGSEH